MAVASRPSRTLEKNLSSPSVARQGESGSRDGSELRMTWRDHERRQRRHSAVLLTRTRIPLPLRLPTVEGSAAASDPLAPPTPTSTPSYELHHDHETQCDRR